MQGKEMEADQMDYIREHALKLTVKELSQLTKANEKTIYAFCKRENIEVKRLRQPKRKQSETVKKLNQYVRPPALYSNRSPYGIARNGRYDGW